MIEIDDKIISAEVVMSKFCCDIAACHGECCVEGNAGAPLDEGEDELLRTHYDHYKQYMTLEGITAIEEQGFAIVDFEGDLTTPLVGDAQCAYTIKEGNSTWCAIEKAYRRGECPINKPISCHLYPIRLAKFSNGTTGLQYHRWSICRSAEICGAKKGVRVFEAVREAIERRFGAEFYEQLTEVAQYIDKEDELHAHSNR